MKVIVRPSRLKGNISAPSSKSSAQRALAAALLFKGNSRILNVGESGDEQAVLKLIRDLDAKTEKHDDDLLIKSNGVVPVTDEVNCGESGLALRMFTPIIALCDKEIRVTGEGSLAERPMDVFDDLFPRLGIKWKSNKGKLPFQIRGPIVPATVTIDGSLSSQFITGLLMVFSAAGAKNVSIHVSNPKSRPYIDLTLTVMKHFGMAVPENRDFKEFVFGDLVENIRLDRSIRYEVEADWSNAAFLLVAGAIAGPVMVRGLDLTSTQADKAIVDVLMQANAGIAMEAKGIRVHPADMNAFEFDATDCPDLFPPLAVLAAFCNGDSVIKGVNRLLHKESNRAVTLQEELGKMGIEIKLVDDSMIITGGKAVKGAEVHSRHDHRIAMACAVAALGASGETVISKAGAVKKSYPHFFEALEKLGADVSLNKKFRWHE